MILRNTDRGDIRIEGPAIAEIGRGLRGEGIDCAGKIVLPGFVNTHHHFYQTLTRGVPKVERAPLFQWLTTLYPIWARLDEEAVRASTMLACAELLLSGCTTTMDHHYLRPHFKAQVEAARELGIRFHPTRGSMSRGRSQGGLPPDEVVEEEGFILDDCERIIDKFHDPATYSMCRVGLAPCSPFSITTDLMKKTMELARRKGVRVHTHIAETSDEDEYCNRVNGCLPLEYLRRCDALGTDVWVAHAVHLDIREIELLAKTGTGVAHCPTSNLRLGSGFALLPDMLARGVPVGLGVDGSASNDSSNMLAEVRMAMLVHRDGEPRGWPGARDALDMATKGGARVLGRDDIGEIKVGRAADLILIDTNQISMAGFADPMAGVVFGTPKIDTVIVNGKVVVERGELKTADVHEIVARANRAARRLLA